MLCGKINALSRRSITIAWTASKVLFPWPSRIKLRLPDSRGYRLNALFLVISGVIAPFSLAADPPSSATRGSRIPSEKLVRERQIPSAHVRALSAAGKSCTQPKNKIVRRQNASANRGHRPPPADGEPHLIFDELRKSRRAPSAGGRLAGSKPTPILDAGKVARPAMLELNGGVM
jgi:hypothetical protein